MDFVRSHFFTNETLTSCPFFHFFLSLLVGCNSKPITHERFLTLDHSCKNLPNWTPTESTKFWKKKKLKNWSYQTMSFTKNFVLNLYFFFQKNSDIFWLWNIPTRKVEFTKKFHPITAWKRSNFVVELCFVMIVHTYPYFAISVKNWSASFGFAPTWPCFINLQNSNSSFP